MCVFFSGCSGVDKRIDDAQRIIKRSGFVSGVIETPTFSLFTARPANFSDTNVLNIVIEGDGYAWVNRYRFSGDPTPKDPIGLKIARALHGKGKDVVYLARPCQFVSSARCGPEYWTSMRYAPEVIKAYMGALDQLSAQYGAREFRITGFSGGAYIALALAAMRHDVTQVNSVAGLMDPDAWSAYHDFSALGVVDAPEILIRRSSGAVFHHFCSADDDILPCTLAEGFAAKAQHMGLNNHNIYAVSGAGHQSVWMEAVKKLSFE